MPVAKDWSGDCGLKSTSEVILAITCMIRIEAGAYAEAAAILQAAMYNQGERDRDCRLLDHRIQIGKLAQLNQAIAGVLETMAIRIGTTRWEATDDPADVVDEQLPEEHLPPVERRRGPPFKRPMVAVDPDDDIT